MKFKKAFKQKFGGILNYLRGVRFEMKKVSWPTKKEVLRYTLIVIFVSFTIAAFLGTLDFIFFRLLNRFIL